MVRLIAILFGIGFIFAGVAGFIPMTTPGGYLFGLFQVDTMHNIVHLVSGVLAIMAATTLKLTKLYFLIFGIVYAIVAIVGFARNGDLFIMQVNMADNFLHLGIGIVAIYLSYYASKQQTS
ncbi:MAG: DUF4383 domain-containing protein [Gammaproteobacteria bacterium]|nr:DUF4383 domain-containing protein [Gammaproteobacteria bacterium]MCW5582630.1 DUF4383 domain-containing protein [Gammaproteobacteria bacterium]